MFFWILSWMFSQCPTKINELDNWLGFQSELGETVTILSVNWNVLEILQIVYKPPVGGLTK